MTRIPADQPTLVETIPRELRGYLDHCSRCPYPDRCDLYTPTSARPGQPGQVVASYRCDNGHQWTRGFAAPDPD